MSRTYKLQGSAAESKSTAVDGSFFNFTVAATYYSDEYQTEVTPSGGTLEILATVLGAGSQGEFFDSPLDATDPSSYATAGSPLASVTVNPIGIVGATHYKVSVTGTK